jgi:membrane protease YdiL (CAAX protease family)
MLSASVVTAFGVVYALWFVVGAFIYVALVRQIHARAASSAEAAAAAGSTSSDPLSNPVAETALPAKTFGLPEAILAALLIFLLLLNLVASVSRPSTDLDDRNLVSSILVTVGVVVFIGAFMTLRGRSIEVLGGLSKFGAPRAIATGAILLFVAYPLISLADVIVQQFFGGGSSKQSIVELFNSSQTIQQRVLIIVFAVVVAPAAEEFMFRFFIYGVLKRYFGYLFGLIANSLLFAAVHGHLPSFAALFVLGCCFTVAYEWSGSILVSMTMHSLFNATTLVILAFPQILQQ